MKTDMLTLSRTTYEKLLTTFMPSEDMRKFLIDQDLTDRNLQELINGSPVSLNTKRFWISDLAKMEDTTFDKDKFTLSYWDILSEYDLALSNLYEPGMYTLEDCWYDLDISEEKNGICGVFTTYEDVKAFIRKRIKEADIYGETDWWTLKKWNTTSGTEPQLLYTYYLMHEEACWFVDEAKEWSREERIRWRNADPFLDSIHMWLPVPYKPGDIVEINTYPFGPKQPAIITEIADDWIDIATRNYQGKWIEGGIVHGFLGHSIYQNDHISALYRIRKWLGKLTRGDRPYE